MEQAALILVDIQNDFVPGGALAVAEGDQILSLVNTLQRQFELVVATQDWHPAHHESFAVHHPGKSVGDIIDLYGLSQVLWPVHCVQNSSGAAFVPALRTEDIRRVFQKGTDPQIDSYSGFFDNGRRKATGLGAYLRNQGIKQVYIVGLATDYCVKYTALDAMSLGFQTYVVADACRAVNLRDGDGDQALADLRDAGVHVLHSKALNP